jgi:cell division protein FtsZ
MVFIAAGMGGGTGTGASPVIARIAREEGALTVAIVTRPFGFEGKKRISQSVEGLTKLKENVDAIIIVSNDKLLMMNGQSPISEAFSESDKVLAQSVKTVTDLILMPAVINLDFEDVNKTLRNSGIALIGFGMGSGPNKAQEAATSAIASPLLEVSIHGARTAIIAVTCGRNVSLFEAQDCANQIVEAAGGTIDMKFGVSINPELEDQILVSVIATDFAEENDFTVVPTFTPIQPRTVEETKEDEVEEDDDSILPNFLKGSDF